MANAAISVKQRRYIAVIDNALDAATFLLEQGANINYSSYLEYSDAGTPLHLCNDRLKWHSYS